MSVTVMQWPNISKFIANIKLKLWKKTATNSSMARTIFYHGDNAYPLSKGTVGTSINIETVSKLQL